MWASSRKQTSRKSFWVKPKTAKRRGPPEQTGQRANHFLPGGVRCSGLRGTFPDKQERPRTPIFQTQTKPAGRPALSPRSRSPGRRAAPPPVPCGDALRLDAPAGGRDISTQSGAHAPAAASILSSRSRTRPEEPTGERASRTDPPVVSAPSF